MVGAAAFLLFVGILISRSLAAYGLIPAVLIGSVALILPERSRSRRWGLASSGVLLVLAVAALTSSSIQQDGFRDRGNDSVVSRVEILRTSVRAIRDFMPVGSGLGTFRQVYHLYEDPGSVGDIYVIHAHNDYLELVLELGLPGVLLIAGFLFWWVRSTWAAWTDPAAGPYARAASIASAAILAHSAVDFPLRTTAISAVFAMCLGLLVERPNLDFRNRSDLWPTRHVVIG
jgi:O-antigen ligase